MTNERKAAFEYADEWLENGFSISPFSLPLEKKVYIDGTGTDEDMRILRQSATERK